MSQKTLLVLAASTYQLDAIRAAKACGARVVTVDNRPENPGHQLADAWYNASTTSREAVLEIARRERPTGVIAPCTDVAIPTVAHIAAELGLTGPSRLAAAVCCDKTAFREFQREQGLPHPQFSCIGPDESDLLPVGSGRWIVKPDRSSGSKGITIVESERDWPERLARSRTFSPTRTVVVEEFIEGFQGTAEGILEDGVVRWMVVLDRQTPAPPYVATCGHRTPTRLPQNVVDDLRRQLEQVWRLLGVVSGPFDCDFVVGENGVVLLEISPRLGGNGITRLLRYATGLDLATYAVRHALGEAPPLPEKIQLTPSAVVIFGADREGRLLFDAEEAAALRREPWLHELTMDCEAGAEVPQFRDGRCRLGDAYLTAPDRETLDRRVEEVLVRMAIRTTVDAEAVRRVCEAAGR